jgi:hypothetical protein
MTLMDIVPTEKHETLVDWLRTKIKEVIVIAGQWADNDVKTNSRLIFDPPDNEKSHGGTSIDEYFAAMSKFRQRLVGFGNKPETIWHVIDSQNVREVGPAIQRSIDEVFNLTREIIHYNRPQTPEDKYPNPGLQPPGSPTDY